MKPNVLSIYLRNGKAIYFFNLVLQPDFLNDNPAQYTRVPSQIVEVVHDDGDEEIEHDEGAEEDEGDKVQVGHVGPGKQLHFS